MIAEQSYRCDKDAQFAQRHDSVVRIFNTSVLLGDLGLRDVQHATTACFEPEYSQERMDLVAPSHQLLLSNMVLVEVVKFLYIKGRMLGFIHCSITGQDRRAYSAQHTR